MRKYYLICLLLILIGSVSAELMFKQNDYVNYHFRCFDENNSYCASTIILVINLEYPNGTNAYNNKSMTFNETFFNVSLPTSVIGTYEATIVGLNLNGTVTEFIYQVTKTGEQVSLSNIIIVIVFIFLSILLFVLGYSFESSKYILKTGFYLFALISILLSLNSARIISSESEGLFLMSTSGIVLVISIILILLLYIFVIWTIQTFKQLKDKKEIRWQ